MFESRNAEDRAAQNIAPALPSSGSEIFKASLDDLRYRINSDAVRNNLTAAWQERLDRIKELTGQEFINPAHAYSTFAANPHSVEAGYEHYAKQVNDYIGANKHLYPELEGIDTSDMMAAAGEHAQRSVMESERAFAGAGFGQSLFYGGGGALVGGLTDPINVILSFAGAGGRQAWSTFVAKEALINVGAELAVEPIKRETTEKLNLEKRTMEDALFDVSSAGLGTIGFLYGVRGLGRTYSASRDFINKAVRDFDLEDISARYKGKRQPDELKIAGKYKEITEEDNPYRGNVPKELEGDYLKLHTREYKEAVRRYVTGDYDPFIEAMIESRLPGMLDAPPPRDFDLGRAAGSRYRDYTKLSAQEKRWVNNTVGGLMKTSPGSRFFNYDVDGQGGTPVVTGYKGDTPEWFSQYNRQVVQMRREAKRIRKINETLPDGKRREVPRVPSILTREKALSVANKLIDDQPLGTAEGEIAELLVGVAREQREINAKQMMDYRRDREQTRRDEIDQRFRDDTEDMDANGRIIDSQTGDTDIEVSREMAEPPFQERFYTELASSMGRNEINPDMPVYLKDDEGRTISVPLKALVDDMEEFDKALFEFQDCAGGL